MPSSTTKPSRGRPRTSNAVEEAIGALARRGYSPTQIDRALRATSSRSAMRVSLRTIQRLHKKHAPPDPTGRWAITDSTPADARNVLEFVAEMIERTEGRQSHVTRRAAEWIARVRGIAPALPYDVVMDLAGAYAARTVNGEATDDLDAFLAFTPWISQERAERYASAVRKGHAAVPPTFVQRAIPHVDGLTFQVRGVEELGNPPVFIDVEKLIASFERTKEAHRASK